MFGAALFGVAGALLAIPVSAMIITLSEINQKRFAIREDLRDGHSPLDDMEAS